MFKKQKLALICDYGLDDAAATLYLLKNASHFEKIDILPIAGNVPLSTSAINAKRLLTYCENVPDNVRVVDTSSVRQNEEYLPSIHGKDGIGDILPPEYSDNIETLDYEKWLACVDDDYTIVSLGPCTVPLDILNKKGAHRLLIMGGNVAEKPNYKGYEFNHAMDIDAFSECVKYKHLTATLDSCHNKRCDFNHIKLNGDGLFEKVVKRAVELSNDRHESGCYIYDLITVVYLLHPEKFSVETAQDKDGNTLSMLRYTADTPIL